MPRVRLKCACSVAQGHFLIEHLDLNSCLLINKINSYTYNFDAQQHIFLPERIYAYAVLAPSVSSRLATESMMMMHRNQPDLNLKIFDDYDLAMQWLNEQLECNTPNDI